MWGVVACTACKRKRIADLSSKDSACPYCGNRDEHRTLAVLHRSRDQADARAALGAATGFSGNAEKRRPSPGIDPLSSLIYEYEHTSGLEARLEVLAKGLTGIYGEFTLEDVEKVEPKRAEQMLGKMLADCYVHETRYGRYRARSLRMLPDLLRVLPADLAHHRLHLLLEPVAEVERADREEENGEHPIERLIVILEIVQHDPEDRPEHNVVDHRLDGELHRVMAGDALSSGDADRRELENHGERDDEDGGERRDTDAAGEYLLATGEINPPGGGRAPRTEPEAVAVEQAVGFPAEALKVHHDDYCQDLDHGV